MLVASKVYLVVLATCSGDAVNTHHLANRPYLVLHSQVIGFAEDAS